VGDREEPLHDRQPAIEVALRVGVADVQAHRLLLVGRGIAVVHQRHVDPDPIREAQEFEVPVEPPPRVLLPEHDHEKRRQEQQPGAADGDGRGGAAGSVVESATTRVAPDRRQDDGDRDDREDAKGRRETVQVAVRIVDREVQEMVVVHALTPPDPCSVARGCRSSLAAVETVTPIA
jgi:hypothetical protein